tara:strand:+ start:214 stop:408 length:195 start_codon:yes stop_codon:yes gene_type:complete
MINKYTGWNCKDCEGKGFILPKIEIDDIEFVKRCKICQKFKNDDEAQDFTEEYCYRIDQSILDI